MKRWIKRTLIGMLGVGAILGGLAACSHHHGHHHAGWTMGDTEVAKLRERFVDKASRHLELDATQQARLGTLADAMVAQHAALRSGGDPRAEVRSLIAGTQFDRAKAQSLIDGKTQAVRDKSPALVSALADFYDSLRPDQQQKLRDLMARGHHG